MSWLSIFIFALVILAFSVSLWVKLIKILDQNEIVYAPTLKKRILWEILFHFVRLIVLLFVIHWFLSLLQQ